MTWTQRRLAGMLLQGVTHSLAPDPACQMAARLAHCHLCRNLHCRHADPANGMILFLLPCLIPHDGPH